MTEQHLTASTVDKMAASDICFEAANYIENHGHTKDVSRSESGEVCLSGAINFYFDNLQYTMQDIASTIASIGNALRKVTGVQHQFHHAKACICDIVHWNDVPERTPDEVIDALKHAGKLLKEQELLDEGSFASHDW